MANVQERTYKYAVSEDGKYVDVEMAGRFELNGEDAQTKAKNLIVSTQQVPESTVKLERVDDLESGVITSGQTPTKSPKKVK